MIIKLYFETEGCDPPNEMHLKFCEKIQNAIENIYTKKWFFYKI